jgi:Ca2+-binding RTX toxin-like protein
VIEYYQNNVNNSAYNSWVEGLINNLNNENKLYTGKDNLGIANGVIIENVKTGSGDDIITDNQVNNRIYTSAGNDKIYVGNGGYDYVDGGKGNKDTLYINLAKDEVSVELYNEGYIMYSDNYGVEFENIELITFNNGVIYEVTALAYETSTLVG